MKIQLQIAITPLLFLICIQQITCEQVSNTSGTRWTCSCSSANQETQQSINAANCSTSCACQPVIVGSAGTTWTCFCSSGELPTLAADNQNSNCFTGCNCTSGSFAGPQVPRKSISSRVVIVLFVCLVLITFAFISSIIWYFYASKKCEPQNTFSDRGSSLHSTTDLIKHQFLSQSPFRNNVGFTKNPIAGCIGLVSQLFRSKMRIINGTATHFTYSELEHATNKFSHDNLIGVGGCSYVYRGHLKDGRTVAVKRLKAFKGLDSDTEFCKEVEIISRLHHYHIVPLLGYCCISLGKQNERLLIFEYLPNGNLRDCLDGEKLLDWDTRVAIALGAARGLEYLHEAAAPRIFHRDVKSTNILLDENWKPKVTDLGMAKCLSTDGFPSCSSSPERIQGTFGYFAPEYAIVGRGSLKSDVFSFGVVLLELITGRTPIFNVSDKADESLVIWAAPRLQDSRRVMSELPDPNLKRQFPEEELQIMAYLAKECLLLDPECRPSMSEVVQVLSTIAPNVSTRRRFPINLFQNLSSNSMKAEQPVLEKSTSQVEVVVDSEELKQMCQSRWSSRCSLSSDIERTLLADSIGKSVDLSSVQYVNSLLYLTSSGSHSSNSNSDGDEIVDLTEPRLESFSIGNDH
ncbi:receptor-like serine/threonine-protein kinase NCRK isoform X1 [Spinacia oleracea]|uniref:non-specific serine/threonine protein kinase n=1 Tax=Spinacia oleracea TaxID=3562 RepID=A0A9R0JBS1_SPIOL|nr:receptor-like serine/threonine-protein kinase NCRK isoform X1 [Spinacia oleracea]XP_021864889.1 receptor-like serine/threonine-protein kinase NCRK isoform X1 [Spinacia oleracea]XP_021864890.1 receptor-like serine/threonine-protein kinase NCRK isoform X1 [Spinacia oleracea]XP_021864892.1 receptor-like serine/threonine-protein kinase NCRK isoform X1 [Spinacia oleracea]XP_056693431.1 receptor-like serine/threonine-protein kinase NCRK isoform X1 [Spinacia oleracea]XP_056693432.1 receptor-like s